MSTNNPEGEIPGYDRRKALEIAAATTAGVVIGSGTVHTLKEGEIEKMTKLLTQYRNEYAGLKALKKIQETKHAEKSKLDVENMKILIEKIKGLLQKIKNLERELESEKRRRDMPVLPSPKRDIDA